MRKKPPRACAYHHLTCEPQCGVSWESADRPVSIRCTRRAGHGGDHVACGRSGCVIAAWPARNPGQEVSARVARLVLVGTVTA